MELERSRSQNREKILKDFRTDEILKAARRVVARVGVAAASVEEIAREAGVAKGTLYLYFDGKETLLARTFEDLISGLIRETREATQRRRSGRRRLEEIVRVGLSLFIEHGAIFSALRREASVILNSDKFADVRAQSGVYLETIADVVADGVESGEFRKVEPLWAARVLTELMRSAITDREPGAEPNASARAVLDFFLHGISQGDAK